MNVSDNLTYAGLFGYLKNATIKNLNITDSSIVITKTDASAGALAGCASGCTIQNCHNNRTSVTANKKTTNNYGIGGLCGWISSTSIQNCSNSGSINGYRYVGGIFGHASSTTEITSCVNSGNVTSINLGAGGIGGYDSGSSLGSTITYCQNSGTIQGLYDVGGILGMSKSAQIQKCSNTGNVVGSNSVNSNQLLYLGAGGICGYADTSGSTKIEDCYNVGSVTAALKAGGILGRQDGNMGSKNVKISNCHNYGNISTTSEDINNYVGAVVGYGSNTTVENCYYLDKSAKNAKNEPMLGYSNSKTNVINQNAV